MFKLFLKEPLWFKAIIIASLLASIILSSSIVPENGVNQGFAKLAAAVFFVAYGINMRRNRKVSSLFFVVAALSIYLSWDSFELARH